MKKVKDVLEAASVKVTEINLKKYIIISVLLLIPTGALITSYVLNQEANKAKKEETSLEQGLLSKGNIDTDVDRSPSDEEEEVEMSSYVIGDDYTEASKSEENTSSSSSSSGTSINIDKSALTGKNISITEGDSFNPIRDLDIKAFDIDGSDLSGRIIIESNNVNTNKAGNYSVKASVKLSSSYTIQKTFDVEVKATELSVNVDSFKAVTTGVVKNGQVTLELELDVSKKHVTAEKVLINEQEYSLYKAQQSIFSLFSKKQKYKVVVKADEQIGYKEYKLGYIKMSDQTLINTDNVASVEILKTEPKVTNFKYVEQVSNNRIVTEFNFEDLDNSVSNLRLNVYKKNKLINSEPLTKKEYYRLNAAIDGNGLYEIKVVGDVDISSKGTEEYYTTDKVIYSESVRIKNYDETSLEGKDIEIVKGEKFEPLKSLELKALDKNGKDITDKIVIESDNVDSTKEGSYEVKVSVLNSYDEKIIKTFKVSVKESSKNNTVEDKKLETQNEPVSKAEVQTISPEENEDISVASIPYENSRSVNRIANKLFGKSKMLSTFASDSDDSPVVARSSSSFEGSESEAITASVTISGNVKNSQGLAPEGRIQVELPTTLTFAINSASELKSSSYSIKNESTCEVTVAVSEFRSTTSENKIKVKPSNESLDGLDRSNIHLALVGDQTVDLGKSINSAQKLIDIPSGVTRIVSLVGEAGKGQNEEIDRNGASDNFTLLFKVTKKS